MSEQAIEHGLIVPRNGHADNYLKRQDDRQLARVKAVKAKWQLVNK
jgi:hypothetical protein